MLAVLRDVMEDKATADSGPAPRYQQFAQYCLNYFRECFCGHPLACTALTSVASAVTFFGLKSLASAHLYAMVFGLHKHRHSRHPLIRLALALAGMATLCTCGKAPKGACRCAASERPPPNRESIKVVFTAQAAMQKKLLASVVAERDSEPAFLPYDTATAIACTALSESEARAVSDRLLSATLVLQPDGHLHEPSITERRAIVARQNMTMRLNSLGSSIRALFDQLDVDGSGTLTPDEMLDGLLALVRVVFRACCRHYPNTHRRHYCGFAGSETWSGRRGGHPPFDRHVRAALQQPQL